MRAVSDAGLRLGLAPTHRGISRTPHAQRARAEADAYAVGLFVGYLLTGMLPTLDGALASLSSDTYHLAADEVALGRGVLESHLTTMASGLCPPLTIAVDVLAWLRAPHPELIEAGAFR